MRLTVQTQQTIRQVVQEIAGPQASVLLFGSRLDDTERGGDIDLLVVSPTHIDDCARKSLQIVARLQLKLGDQPIDVLIVDPETVRLPVHVEALRTGVEL